MAAGAFLSLLAAGAFLLLLIGSPHVFPLLPVEPRQCISMHQLVFACLYLFLLKSVARSSLSIIVDCRCPFVHLQNGDYAEGRGGRVVLLERKQGTHHASPVRKRAWGVSRHRLQLAYRHR